MRQISATHRSKVIDLLSARLAFERAAVGLYDAALEMLSGRRGPFASVRAHLRCIREEEKAHQEWLTEQVQSLGGDACVETESSRAIQLETLRLSEEVDPARVFQALLNAELADNGGWELLAELADRAGDEQAHDEFLQRLHEEQEHLLYLNRLATISAQSDTFDETVTMLEDASA